MRLEQRLHTLSACSCLILRKPKGLAGIIVGVVKLGSRGMAGKKGLNKRHTTGRKKRLGGLRCNKLTC